MSGRRIKSEWTTLAPTPPPARAKRLGHVGFLSLSLSLSLGSLHWLSFVLFARCWFCVLAIDIHLAFRFLLSLFYCYFFRGPIEIRKFVFFSSVEDGDFQLKLTRIFSPAWRSVVDRERERERLGNTKVGPIKNEKKLLKASHTSDRVAFNITESLFLSYRESSVNGTIISQHRLKWSEKELGRPHRPLYIES